MGGHYSNTKGNSNSVDLNSALQSNCKHPLVVHYITFKPANIVPFKSIIP